MSLVIHPMGPSPAIDHRFSSNHSDAFRGNAYNKKRRHRIAEQPSYVLDRIQHAGLDGR